jgi:hypothetical protein
MRVTESSGSLKDIKSLPFRLSREHLDHRHSAGIYVSSVEIVTAIMQIPLHSKTNDNHGDINFKL